MSSQKPELPDVKSNLVVQTNDQCEGDHKLNEACDEVIKEVEILIPILKYFSEFILVYQTSNGKNLQFLAPTGALEEAMLYVRACVRACVRPCVRPCVTFLKRTLQMSF